MEMNARNNDPVFTDCYNVLFAYHISRENYWKGNYLIPMNINNYIIIILSCSN